LWCFHSAIASWQIDPVDKKLNSGRQEQETLLLCNGRQDRILCMKLLFTILPLLLGSKALAYPEFIGFGYDACLTCHVNGLGSGPLNDYGRALWGAELASRALYPKKMSDEAIGAQGGFFGSKELPYWLRPHMKYRTLNLRTNPGSGASDNTMNFQMQFDVGSTFQIDEDAKYVFQFTYGNMAPPDKYGSGKAGMTNMKPRDYYARVEVLPQLWIYAGLLSKAYGIRNIDHASYQRKYQTFKVVNDSNDGIEHSLGVIAHKVFETWEIAVNLFGGNPQDKKEYKQTGASVFTEFTTQERRRFGVSALTAKSDVLEKQLAGVTYRQGLSKGSAFLFEYGFIQDKAPADTSPKLGSYNLLQGSLLLTRGYMLKTTIERYNKEFKPTEPDQWRWGAGLMMFPAPRFELRAEMYNGRSFSNSSVADDSWTFQGQIHVSL
jgi:hypothetical protein